MKSEASYVQVPGSGRNSVALIQWCEYRSQIAPRAVLVGKERLESFHAWVPCRRHKKEGLYLGTGYGKLKLEAPESSCFTPQ